MSARKAASHDLKGLTHYYSCQIPGLHVPLMARTLTPSVRDFGLNWQESDSLFVHLSVIDYLGFRLIAITILPINSHTIQYGSYVMI